MNEIIKKTDIVIAPTIQGEEKQIVLAKQSQRMNQIDTRSAITRIVEAWTKATFRLGLNTKDENDVILNCQILVEDIKTQFPLMAIDEICNAINFGSCGKYEKDGNFVHLSVTNVLKWCKAYENTKGEILKRQIEYIEKQKIQEMEEKKHSESSKKFWRELGGRIAEHIEQGKTESMMASIWFYTLEDIQVIQLGRDEKLKIFEQAKIKTREYYRERRANLNQIKDILHSSAKKTAREMSFYSWADGIKGEKKNQDIKILIDNAVKKYKPELFDV